MKKVINSKKAKNLKERLALLALAFGLAAAPMTVFAEDIVLADGSEEETEEVVPTEASSQPETEEPSEPTPTKGYTDPDDPVPTTEDIGDEESEEERKNPPTTPTPTPEDTPTPTPTPETTPTPTPTPETTPTPEITPPPPPKTGDASAEQTNAPLVTFLGGVAILSIGGTAYYIGKRKEENVEEDESIRRR